MVVLVAAVGVGVPSMTDDCVQMMTWRNDDVDCCCYFFSWKGMNPVVCSNSRNCCSYDWCYSNDDGYYSFFCHYQYYVKKNPKTSCGCSWLQ